MQRIFGAGLILAGSITWSLQMIRQERHKTEQLHQLQQGLRMMINELTRCRSPLPVLLEQVAAFCTGDMGQFFLEAAGALNQHTYADAPLCINTVVLRHGLRIPYPELLIQLGHSLGRYDADGQLRELELLHEQCAHLLQQRCTERKDKFHRIRTLGICGGIAVVILLS